MTGARRTRRPGDGLLVAVDGVDAAAVTAAAKAAIADVPRRDRGGISGWDASGVFGDLAVADDEAGRPSARTLLLLYAADLAFRLRWEIRPLVAQGRVVVAAPYVATAIAFGRAAGLSETWLADLFGFAPQPGQAQVVAGPKSNGKARAGFVEFSSEQMAAMAKGPTRAELIARARKFLKSG